MTVSSDPRFRRHRWESLLPGRRASSAATAPAAAARFSAARTAIAGRFSIGLNIGTGPSDRQTRRTTHSARTDSLSQFVQEAAND